MFSAGFEHEMEDGQRVHRSFLKRLKDRGFTPALARILGAGLTLNIYQSPLSKAGSGPKVSRVRTTAPDPWWAGAAELLLCFKPLALGSSSAGWIEMPNVPFS